MMTKFREEKNYFELYDKFFIEQKEYNPEIVKKARFRLFYDINPSMKYSLASCKIQNILTLTRCTVQACYGF